MNLSGKRVAVIGGAGFIGSHVVEELLKTDVAEIIIYDNFARGKQEYIAPFLLDPRCTLFQNGGDIRDTDVLNDALKGVHGVFLLAAMWLLHCRDYPRTAFDVNVQGTFNVLEACVNNNVERLVYSSSASVYGDAVELPMKETHPLNNRNFYGATKIACEAMCRAMYDRYGLNYVALRYMNVYGPHQDQTAAYTGVIPIVLNKIDSQEPPKVNGDGSQSYDFIDVRDVARCNVLAMQSQAADDYYNVGTGVQTSIRNLCETLLMLRESNLQVQYSPYSESDSRSLVQNRIGCTEKAFQELGFRSDISLEQGLRHLIQWRRLHAN
ncbi:NAD-dependent epimerase/dehydratase family protein [Alteromonas oceanisediminis]|uniref:NAD-dependent epimerase/dehydratase family protein n=1 Tax=Alteromonas oceanisediminis TaxID=2836180 RepID=UPI001BD9F80B|nr:NAD-dependent epimerase/dehydratase family protein [Alteromonas oceanisediminis]MBT0584941.1 NAD-dependent epimerase/dehydratase family protein [Alteromonas oceanisediminis]